MTRGKRSFIGLETGFATNSSLDADQHGDAKSNIVHLLLVR